MTHFNAIFYIHLGTVVRARAGTRPSLNVEPDNMGGCVTFLIDDRCTPEEQLKIAERFAAEAVRWRNELTAHVERTRTTAAELANVRAENARLRAGATAAAEWNKRHPVGTPVFAYLGTRDDEPLRTVTRSPAWTLGHGDPVVSVEGESGGICLTHIDVIKDDA